jgi:hypothetical protein
VIDGEPVPVPEPISVISTLAFGIGVIVFGRKQQVKPRKVDHSDLFIQGVCSRGLFNNKHTWRYCFLPHSTSMRLNEAKSSKFLMNLLKALWLKPDICLRQIACAAT